jgi:hypothetical protein
MKRLVSAVLVALLAASSALADCVLRQSDTAELPLGPFVDATDGVTAETALTISQADVRLKKCTAAGDCAAWAQVNESTAAAHEENGWYEKDIDTTDTNTVGILQIAVHESGALPVFLKCLVVEEAVYDRDYAGSATGIVGTAQTGDAFARLGAPAGASHAADLLAIDNFVDDLESRLGTPSNLGGGATLAANAADIEAQTDDIGVAGAGLTVLATQASVNAVDDFVDTEVAAILDDTGTSGVVVAEVTTNCREVLGCDTQGTLSGTHSTTTADLGTNAPSNDITGMTLVVPTHNFSRAITSYNTGTGVATFDTTAVTLANGNQYYLHATAPSSGGSGLDAAGVRAAVGLASANLDTQLSTIDNFIDTEVAEILTDTSTTLDDFVDDLESRLGTPSNLGGGATVSANLSDIEGQTDDIGVAGAGLSATDDAVMTRLGAPVGASLSADLQVIDTNVDDVETDTADMQPKLGTFADLGSGATLSGNLEDMRDNGTAAFDRATDSLQAIRDRGDAAWTGGGGTSDWTADERTALRTILGIPASGTTPDDPTAGILDTIRDNVGTKASQASVDAVDDFVDTELATVLSRLGIPTDLGSGATLAANSADIEAQTDDIGVAGAGLTATDDAVITAVAALVAQIRDSVSEDQGGGVSRGCIEAVLLAFAAGDISTSAGTTTWRDPSNGEVRITSTVASAGNRTASITCPTY